MELVNGFKIGRVQPVRILARAAQGGSDPVRQVTPAPVVTGYIVGHGGISRLRAAIRITGA
jgi:hypothetical protein